AHHADPPDSEVARERQRQGDDPALRCGIGGLAGLTLDPGDRRRIDDQPPLAQLTSRSTRPKRSAAPSTPRSTATGSLTSTSKNATAAPSCAAIAGPADPGRSRI